MVDENITALIGRLGTNARQVVLALSEGFAPVPRGISRQLVAHHAMQHSDLIDREWQDGCARCTYYRLTPLGAALQAHLQQEGR